MSLFRRWDKVTLTLAFLNVVAYIYNLAVNGTDALTGIDAYQMEDIGGLSGDSHIITYLTSMFAHGSFTHFIMNMLMLFLIGSIIYQEFGTRLYVLTYLVSGLAGELASTWLQPETTVVGASGAIFGLIGMLLVGTFTRPSLKPLRGAVIIMVVFSLLYPYTTFLTVGSHAISVVSHIGGLMVGTVITGYLLLKKRI